MPFRATKDIDMILIMEDNFPEFAAIFWEYIKEGGYKCGWKNEENMHFYRFTEGQFGYPTMIELLLSVKLDAPAPCRLDAPDLDLICYASADCSWVLSSLGPQNSNFPFAFLRDKETARLTPLPQLFQHG